MDNNTDHLRRRPLGVRGARRWRRCQKGGEAGEVGTEAGPGREGLRGGALLRGLRQQVVQQLANGVGGRPFRWRGALGEKSLISYFQQEDTKYPE